MNLRIFVYKLKRMITYYSKKIRGYILFNTSITIGKNVNIPYPETVTFAGRCEIMNNVQIKTDKKSFVNIGKNTLICSYTTIEAAGGTIKIGDNIYVGEYSTFQGQGNITLEDNVLLASHIHFISNQHTYTDIDTPIKYQENISKPIIIKENTWIGINVVILSGVTIGKHCVIGSNSVVNCDIPDYCVAVGSPVKIIKKYDFDLNMWTKTP